MLHPRCARCAEYLETMRDKQLVVRTDALEAAFAQLEAQQGLAPGGGGGGAGE